MEELQEIHPEHKKKPGNCTNSIVALQDHCAVVKKRQQQTTISKKKTKQLRVKESLHQFGHRCCVVLDNFALRMPIDILLQVPCVST